MRNLIILSLAILTQTINTTAQNLVFIETNDVFGRRIGDTMELKVVNNGGANESFVVYSHYSTNTDEINENSLFLGGVMIASLEPGDTVDIHYSLDFSDVPAGLYFLVSSIYAMNEQGEYVSIGEHYAEESVFLIGNSTTIQNVSQTSVKVYPNPVIDITTLEFPEYCEGFISLYGLSGKKINQFFISGFSLEIDLSFLGEGIYFLRYKTYSFKVIKK